LVTVIPICSPWLFTAMKNLGKRQGDSALGSSASGGCQLARLIWAALQGLMFGGIRGATQSYRQKSGGAGIPRCPVHPFTLVPMLVQSTCFFPLAMSESPCLISWGFSSIQAECGETGRPIPGQTNNRTRQTEINLL
jgi:hypothetical protein